MKRAVILPIALAVAGGAIWGCKIRTDGSDATHKNASPPAQVQPPDTTVTDSTAVFQRAFWKRPTAADKILHAERREWKDENAVSRWQWFLEVEPSPEIVSHLRENNSFRLQSAGTAAIPADAPDWFIRNTKDTEILAAPGGGMSLIFTPGDAKLYAMGAGGGFRAGAPETPAPVPTTPVTTGRFPNTPPPNPAKK